MAIINDLKSEELNKKNKGKLQKVVELMQIGELCGLHTLNSLLSALGIKSTQYYKLWKGCTLKQSKELLDTYCELEFTEHLVALAQKSSSSWSRAEVTIVIDDSIFKQWLKNMPIGTYFAKYYSGQTHCSVYGFRVTALGIAIGDNFFPLYHHLSPKCVNTKEVALDLLKKAYELLEKLADTYSLSYPNLFLSVDSGFTYSGLLAYCEEKNIGFIGVPKKNNKIQIGRYNLNVKKYIEKVYLKQEQKHIEKYQKQGKEPPAFLLRKKAYVSALGREVILIFFRLNGSKRVSVIYATAMSAMAKTLRRRFFQRTKIEIFFRFLKDTLKIQQSTCTDLTSFKKKLNLFILKNRFCRKFERLCRNRIRGLKKYAFTKLRHHLIYENLVIPLLEIIVKKKGFCKEDVLLQIEIQ